MRAHRWIGAFLLTLLAGGQGISGEPCYGGPVQDDFVQRIHPVGGWHPYGGGLLHWCDPHCFPCCCGPDDYCRKPLPRVCWPGYPSFYTWGPPQICHPQSSCPRDCNKPQ